MRALPPRPALVLGVQLAAPIVLGVAVAALVGGEAALLGVVVGVLVAAPMAITSVPWSVRGLLTTSAAAGAVAGQAAQDAPLLLAGVVALAALVQAPMSSRASAGVGAMLPVVPAMTASVPVAGAALPLGIGVVAGCALAVAVAAALGVRTPRTAVSSRLAWRHGLATAAATGLAAWWLAEHGPAHGYWLVLTLAVVSRPVPAETRSAARDRALGTALGFCAAVPVVVLLPSAVAAVAAVACLVVSVAWALAEDVRMQSAYTTPMVVLASSSGLVGDRLAVAVERVGLTLAGAGLALLLALALLLLDERTAAPGTRPA